MHWIFSTAQLATLRRTWGELKIFRWALIVSLVYFILRLGVQLMFLWDPASQEIAADLQTYLNGAQAFQQRQDLYIKGALDVVNFYQYAPFYALTFAPFLWLSPLAVAVVHTLIHLAAYVLLYVWWSQIFQKLGLVKASAWMVWSLPVWIIFSAFWGDLAYLNIYLIVALLATLLIDAVLQEQLGWGALWFVLIMQVKPHWAFAAMVPLLMGRRAFFARLVGLALLGYAGTVLFTVAVGGSYAWQQYLDYFRFLPGLSASFPWRGPDSGFMGYNHSVKQVMVFFLGVSPVTLALADVVKTLLLVPLAMVAIANFIHPVGKRGPEDPQRFLDLAFALYLGAFIWLDMVWELSLGIAVFVYLLGTLESRGRRMLVWAGFILYAIIDIWQIASYLIFGSQILIQDAYIATDPSIYAPVILIAILIFYAVIIERLWAVSVRPWRATTWKMKSL